MTKDNHKKSLALNCLSPPVKAALERHLGFIEDSVTDIHLRLSRPIALTSMGENFYISSGGTLLRKPSDKAVVINKADLNETFNKICRYSVYSVQRELTNGFVTIAGGHRAGICGTAVMNSDSLTNIRDISSINLRLCREVTGCCTELIASIKSPEKGVLICGEPCSGKTTILRDIARYISINENKSVSLIDERGELAAALDGENQNDVGLCDVFSLYPKHRAIEHALRCMSPDYIVCDELGTIADVKAVESCLNSGVSVIATLHCTNPDELKSKPNAYSLLKTGAFQSIVFLESRKNVGRIREIIRAGDLLAS